MDISMRLRIGNSIIIFAYLDAAHAVHSNCLSQSGITILFGDAMVYAPSKG